MEDETLRIPELIMFAVSASAPSTQSASAETPTVSNAAAAEATLQLARYEWHKCVTLGVMDEVAAGWTPGVSLSIDNCQDKEDAVQQELLATLGADGDYGYAAQQMEEWRSYEIRWAKRILEVGASVEKPKTFKLHR